MKGFMLNEEIVTGHSLRIDPREAFFAHGCGLFETMRVHGGRPCFYQPHVDRMRHTARALEFPFEVDDVTLKKRLVELAVWCKTPEARTKVHLLCKNDGQSDVLLTCEATPPPTVFGETVALGRAHPRFNGATAMPGLKTMNYMVNRLAEEEGRKRGVGEVVFIDADDRVLEGTRSTAFMVKDGALITSPLDLPILPGVTRSVILALARDLGLKVHERAFTFVEMQSADEAFMTGSMAGIRPVSALEDRNLVPVPGPVTSALAESYFDALAREAADG